jgi:hypothetical protein
MANGVAAHLPSELSPPAPTTQPNLRSTEIGEAAGHAVADAVEIVGLAVTDFVAAGVMAPGTKTLGGERLGRVAELLLEHDPGEIDFATVARREGRRILHERHGVAFRQHFGSYPETVINELVDEVLGIADKVVAIERAMAN